MRRQSLLAVAGAVLLAVAPEVSSAQMAKPDLGVTGGVNFATASGKDVQDAKMLTTFMAGLSAIFPINNQFSFQPELLYSRKGAKFSDAGSAGSVKLAYIDVPLLLKIGFPTQSSIKPALYIGPSISYNMSCDIEESGGGASVSSSCSDAGLKPKSLDYGIVAGGGIDFGTMNFFARYQYGLANIGSSSDAGDAKNRVVTVGARFSFSALNK
jgi:hypothetical protein